MADENKGASEGYHNAEDRAYEKAKNQSEEVMLEDAPRSQIEAPMHSIKNHKRQLSVILFAIVILLLAFYLVRSFQNKDNALQQQTAELAQQNKQAVEQLSSSLEQVSGVGNQLQTLVTAHDQTAKDLQQQMAQLKASLSTLQSQLDTLRKTTDSQQANLRLLLQKEQERAQKKAAPASAPAPVVQKKAKPTVTYVVKAVVPGRAWISSSRGGTFTVSVGDEIEGYGSVESVDSELGEVTTSSGKVIHYGEDDR